jgi:hypothetical protein
MAFASVLREDINPSSLRIVRNYLNSVSVRVAADTVPDLGWGLFTDSPVQCIYYLGTEQICLSGYQ